MLQDFTSRLYPWGESVMPDVCEVIIKMRDILKWISLTNRHNIGQELRNQGSYLPDMLN